MGFLANFRIRNKLLIAMLPLAMMAIGAGVYSSIKSEKIDTWYSNLIDNYAASATIARLRSLLDASDGGAEEAFRSLQDAVAGVVDRPDLDALSASISDFDFTAALVKLDGIAEQCCAKVTRQ
jgi:hypothetical protein